MLRLRRSSRQCWSPRGLSHWLKLAILPAAGLRFAPKKVTHWQLFACLVVKIHQKKNYRGVWELLLDSTDLRQSIGLEKVPHWTTLQKNAGWLLTAAGVQKLLESALKLSRPRRRVKHSAADSLGSSFYHPATDGPNATKDQMIAKLTPVREMYRELARASLAARDS